MNTKFEAVNFESSKPLYLQITEIIEQKIRNRELVVGQKLPPQNDLSKTFNVSKVTVGEAISNLMREGYLSSRPTYGTFVISSEPKKDIYLERKNEISIVSCPYQDKDRDNNILSGVFVYNIIKGVERKAREKNLYLLYSTLNESGFSLKGRKQNVAGLILIGDIISEYLKIIKKSKIPYLLIGDILQKTKTHGEVDVIVNDDFNGSYLATKHLIELGHKRIVYFTVSTNNTFCEVEYFRGYQHALKEAGISCNDDLVIETGKNTKKDAYIAMKKLLDKSIPSPTGLVCLKETFLPGITKALNERGLRIPQDISLVNNGVNPNFTLITVDSEQMGMIAVERLIKKLIEPDKWQPERIVVPYKLIPGNSTGKLEGGSQ